MGNTEVHCILRRPEVERRIGLSRATIYKLMSEGSFPKPVRLAARAVGWRETDINDWLESRIQGGGE